MTLTLLSSMSPETRHRQPLLRARRFLPTLDSATSLAKKPQRNHRTKQSMGYWNGGSEERGGGTGGVHRSQLCNILQPCLICGFHCDFIVTVVQKPAVFRHHAGLVSRQQQATSKAACEHPPPPVTWVLLTGVANGADLLVTCC